MDRNKTMILYNTKKNTVKTVLLAFGKEWGNVREKNDNHHRLIWL